MISRIFFKKIREKIEKISTYTKVKEGDFYHYEIECLGFKESITLIIDLKTFTKHYLVNMLLGNPNFLKKFEQIENRKKNLQDLFD